jgi:hypothetical protein
MNIVEVNSTSNRDFLEHYACAGRVGLVGGANLIERVIKRAERRIQPERKNSSWSHAMLFQGRRADGHHWVIESDLEGGLKHLRLGVQENRVSKYFDGQEYPELAILDFGLDDAQVRDLLIHSLDLVAGGAVYSLRELFGTALALYRPKNRANKNRLAQEKSMYCSGMVQYAYNQLGLDLIPGVHPSHGTPEELSRSPLIQTAYHLVRQEQR